MPHDSTQPQARVLGVIPARLQSHRLPHKMLRAVAGRPLLWWTYQAATRCPQFRQVIVAVDSQEVSTLCEQNGWPYRLTSPSLPSGTDRLHAISLEVEADIYVNVQGDEPMISPDHIEDLLRPFTQEHVDVTTLKVRCLPEEVGDPNAVKVVTAQDGRALYFSRSPIPYVRDKNNTGEHWKHLGLYAYRRRALHRFAALPEGELEKTERLEQLRLLENGLSLYVSDTATGTIGVDTETDLARVESELLRRNGS